MLEILEKLKEFRIARNIDASQGYEFVLNKQVGFMLSECSEYLDADNEFDKVDALCDISVFAINAYFLISKDQRPLFEIEDSYGDGITIHDIINSTNHLLKSSNISMSLSFIVEKAIVRLGSMEYDFEKCMLETIKEISSRTQDPIQAIEWQENGASGKWQKDKNQDASTRYEANYGLCKIV